MATTYSTLLTEVASFLARSDLTTSIPTFVQFAQARINRKVRAQAMETKNATFSITGEYVNVPSDFKDAFHFYLNTTPRRTLKAFDAEGMTDLYTTSGQPKYFEVVGTQFRFSPVPDATYSATLIYYAKPATLATTTQETNSLFPTNADLYLYASLLQAEAFLADDPRLAVWKNAFDEAIEEINREAKLARYAGGSLATRPG